MSRTASADVRRKILEAAKERLWHFGFRKTTIDEIAADAGVGKGTVYLHFNSKEDIALAIMGEFKKDSLDRQKEIALSSELSPLQKLTEVLLHPILLAHERCSESPAAQEMIVAIRPHIRKHMQPFLEQEISLVASILEQGNHAKLFRIKDTMQAARSLKFMCAGFWPPYPCVEEARAIRSEIEQIVALAYAGLKRGTE